MLASVSADSVIAIVGGVFSCAVVLFSAFLVSKTKAAQQAIELLSTVNNAQKNQIETDALQREAQERRIAELERQLEAERKRSTKQDERIAELGRMVQGLDAINALSQTIQDNHRAVLEAIGRLK